MIVKGIFATVVLCTIFFIIKRTVWFHIRNWLMNNKLQPPYFSEYTKHYVRIIKKTQKPTEFIREIKNEEFRIPINEGEELIYTATIDKDDNDRFYLTLRNRDSNTPIRLNPIHDLNVGDEQIRLIYTNIKTYGKN